MEWDEAPSGDEKEISQLFTAIHPGKIPSSHLLDKRQMHISLLMHANASQEKRLIRCAGRVLRLTERCQVASVAPFRKDLTH